MTTTPEATSPRYTHDCKKCTFLGRRGQDDLYFCTSSVEATVIARHSPEGRDYASGMAFSFGMNAALTAARVIAQARGLFAYDLNLALRSTNRDAPTVQKLELKAHLEASELGRALSLLATDAEAGTNAISAYMAGRVTYYEGIVGPDSGNDIQDWARSNVSVAQDWMMRLGLPHAPYEVFLDALHPAK